MKFRTIALNAITTLALLVSTYSAHAILPNGTTLTIDDFQVVEDPPGTFNLVGSQFLMHTNPGQAPIRTPIQGENGITLGSGQPAGTGSKTGFVIGGDNGTGSVTAPWSFFSNTGHEFTQNSGIVASTATTDPDSNGIDFTSKIREPDGFTEFLDFSNWAVSWNNIPVIDMGGGFQDCGTDSDGICVIEFDPPDEDLDIDGTSDNGSGLAHLTCFSDAERTEPKSPCEAGDFYRLGYSTKVPLADPSGFGGVLYEFQALGSIVGSTTVIANDDMAVTTTGATTTIDILGNDEPAASLDPASVSITSGPTTGTATVNADGSISYTAANSTSMDSFDYSVSNTSASATDSATVTVDVQLNVPPVANSFSVGVDTETSTAINVLENTTDANDNINPTSVMIVTPPGLGSASVNADGSIQYVAPANSGTDLFTYEVSDTVGATSSPGTVNVSITDFVCDAGSIPDSNITNLFFEAGVPGDLVDTGVPAKSGSFFTMQVSPEQLLFTVLEAGPDGGISIGRNQPAGLAHNGPVLDGDDDLVGVDRAWPFFGNTGWDLTKNGGIKIADNGCLDFTGNGDTVVLGANQGSWIVTWNLIPEIDLGGCVPPSPPEGNCPLNTVDLGIASIACDPAPCADGSNFSVKYAAHVPVGDPSGFGGVPYTLFMDGVMGSMPDALIPSSGTLSAVAGGKIRLDRSEVVPETELDPETGELLVTRQCMGDCFEYEITGVMGSTVQIIIPLAIRIPPNALFRVFKDGAWKTFDTSNGVDSVKSAPYTPGDGACPTSTAAYVDGLVAGNQCLLVVKTDNGPNDTNPTTGIVRDPSGVGVSIAPPAPLPFRAVSESGCSASSTKIQPLQRTDWWLLLGMLALLGVTLRRRRMRN